MPPATMRILVVEDDARMLELLCRGLREAGHAVMPATDGQVALELADRLDFDALVLDVGLPHRDGFAITQALKAHKPQPRILILSARDTEDDVVRGLELGADDYLVKPFSFPELIARLQSLRRPATWRPQLQSLAVDAARLTVFRDSTPVRLTRTEFLLFTTLLQADGKTVARSRLLECVWGKQASVPANSLDVLVNGLRAKLDAPFATKLIATVRGIGYRLDEATSNASGVMQVTP